MKERHWRVRLRKGEKNRSARAQNSVSVRIFFRLSVLETFWSRKLKQEIGIETPEYLKRVSVTLGAERVLRGAETVGRKLKWESGRQHGEGQRVGQGSVWRMFYWARQRRGFPETQKQCATENKQKNMILNGGTLEGALNLESDKDTVSNGCFSVLYWRS